MGSSIRCNGRVAFDFFNWEDLTALVNSGIARASLSCPFFRGLPDPHHTPKYRKNGNVNPIAKAAAAWTM
jgi:hypothetical protein